MWVAGIGWTTPIPSAGRTGKASTFNVTINFNFVMPKVNTNNIKQMQMMNIGRLKAVISIFTLYLKGMLIP